MIPLIAAIWAAFTLLNYAAIKAYWNGEFPEYNNRGTIILFSLLFSLFAPMGFLVLWALTEEFKHGWTL